MVQIAKLLPPRIVLEAPKTRYVKTADASIEIAFCVEPEGNEAITGIDVLLNGRPLTQRGIKVVRKTKRVCQEHTIALEEGYSRQNITILARNRHASANPVVIEVERQALTASLLKYCELDTLAMVMIYEALKAFVEG